ncbi:polycystin-2-like [Eurosta solidaginis]|uniref:polycystin-2-like n=1 Tax=Eurosta solidaginis TaxID=178769 RepID=UPI003530FA02
MKAQRKIFILLGVCISTAVLCLILVACFSGFRHESRKFRALLFVIAFVLFFHVLIGDFIKFLAYATYSALKKKPPVQEGPDVGRSDATDNYYEDALARLQMASHDAAMYVTSAHYNESLNLKYKQILNDMRLYGLYFFLLLLLVVGSRDPLAYYNTNTIETVLLQKRLDKTGLLYLNSIDDVYDYLDRIIVKAFNLGQDYNGEVIVEPGWIQYGIAKLMSVVRLRQVRRADNHIQLSAPNFVEQSFMPRWKLPFEDLRYINQYIHTYGPWLEDQMERNLFTPKLHYGDIHTYAEDNGYVAFLSRDYENSKKILRYLKKSHWIDRYTAAIFVDFTLYNVDPNIFSVCTILLEYTPFGNVLPHIEVLSVELLMNLDNIPGIFLLIFLVYLFVLIYFTKNLILNMMYKTKISASPWNIVDCIIIGLNIFIIIIIVVREFKVLELMRKIDTSMKLDFVDFRIPAQIDYLANLCIGFLICLATLRLWKVFQFAKPFRVFTRTLYRARWALLTLLLVIIVWLFAIGISSYIINGNYTPHFTRLLRSFSAAMSFSFGFSHTVSPEDLTYGGLTLGFILYALLMFVIAIILLNLFITLICDHFTENKNTPDDDEASELSFLDFLRVEFGGCWRWFKNTCCCSCCNARAYDPGKDNVKENIEKSVQKAEHKREQLEKAKDKEETPAYSRKLRELRQVRAMANKMNTQVAILRRYQRWFKRYAY